jgi:hypothetical protein
MGNFAPNGAFAGGTPALPVKSLSRNRKRARNARSEGLNS